MPELNPTVKIFIAFKNLPQAAFGGLTFAAAPNCCSYKADGQHIRLTFNTEGLGHSEGMKTHISRIATALRKQFGGDAMELKKLNADLDEYDIDCAWRLTLTVPNNEDSIGRLDSACHELKNWKARWQDRVERAPFRSIHMSVRG